MAETTISYKVDITQTNESKRRLIGLQTEFDKSRKALSELNKAERAGNITTAEASRKRADLTTKLTAQRNALNDQRAAILKSNDALRKNSGFVAGVSAGFKDFAKNMLGPIALIGLFTKAISSTFNVVRDYEQAQADLASVLDVTVEEMEALTEQSKELGATTRFTASEVAGLQKEYAKLGFTQEEILNVTDATLQLAAATGTDLERAATVTGSTLRAFGLDATETQRVVDVMAKSFSSSSLDMEKFATAMSTVAPVAKTAGLNIEETTALLGTLTDRGLEASTAGTGLRNIFLELSKQGITFEDAMLKINEATDKNAEALDLFGKRGATIGVILSETSDDVANLESKLNDAGGAAQEMADKQLKTLNGQLALLKSAWEGILLDLEEGTGIFTILKEVIGFVAKNLSTIVKTVAALGTAFLVYKTIQKATKAFKALTLAMNANPILFAASALVGLVVALDNFIDSATTAEKIEQGLLDVRKKAEKSITNEINSLEILTEVAKDETLSKEKRLEAIEELNRISPEYLGNLTLENIATEEGAEITQRYADELIRSAEAKATRVKIDQLSTDILELENAELEVSESWLGLIAAANGNLLVAQQLNLEARQENVSALKEERQAYIDNLTERIKQGEISISEATGLESNVENANKNIGLIKGINNELKNEREKLNEALSVSDIRSTQKRIKRLQAEKDDLLGIEKKAEKKKKDAKDTSEADAEKRRKEALALDKKFLNDSSKQLELNLKEEALTREVSNDEFINLEISRLQTELKLNEIYGEDTIAVEQDIQARKLEIRQNAAATARETAARTAENEQAARDATLEKELAGLDVLSNALSTFETIKNEKLDRETALDIQRVVDSSETQINLLQNRLDKGLISEAEFKEGKLKLDQEREASELSIKRDAFNKTKKLDQSFLVLEYAKELASIAANAAANPLNAVTVGGAGVSQYAILAAIATGKFISNTALIQTQKFKDGGILRGRSHAMGGIDLGNGNEGEGGEAIINERSTKLFGSILSDINVAGGGVPFENKVFAPIKKYATGGILGRPVPSVANILDNNILSKFVEAINQNVDNVIRRIRVENNVRDTTAKMNEVAQVDNLVNLG